MLPPTTTTPTLIWWFYCTSKQVPAVPPWGFQTCVSELSQSVGWLQAAQISECSLTPILNAVLFLKALPLALQFAFSCSGQSMNIPSPSFFRVHGKANLITASGERCREGGVEVGELAVVAELRPFLPSIFVMGGKKTSPCRPLPISSSFLFQANLLLWASARGILSPSVSTSC